MLLPKSEKGFIPITLLVVLVLIILTLGYFYTKKNPPTNTVSTNQTNSSPKGEIAYVNGGQIYLYNVESKQSNALPIQFSGTDSAPKDLSATPGGLVFSPDGRYLYFNYNDESGLDLYIYDFQDKQTKIIKKFGPRPTAQYFSPDGKYVVFDTGSAPGNRGRTLTTADGQIIASLFGTSLAWSPDSTEFALARGDITLDLPLGPQPQNNSIYIERISQNGVLESLLVKADYQNSYIPVKWTNDDTLIVAQDTYSKPITPKPMSGRIDESYYSEWIDIYNKPSQSFFEINTNSKEQRPVSEVQFGNNQYDLASYSSDGIWKVFADQDKIYIARSDNSQKSEIGQGEDPVWRITN